MRNAIVLADSLKVPHIEWEQRVMQDPFNPRLFSEVFESFVRLRKANNLQERMLQLKQELERSDLPLNQRAIILNLVALAHKANHEHKEALDYCRKSIDIDPKNPNFRNSLAITLEDVDEQSPEAEEQYRTAVSLDKHAAKFHNNLALHLFSKQKYDEAIEETMTAIVLSPNDAGYRANCGMILGGSGRYDEAVAQFNLSISIDPTDRDTYFNYGLLCLEANEWEAAEKQLKKALEIDENDAEVLYTLGSCMDGLGDKLEAIKYLKRAIEIKEDYEFLQHLGLVLIETMEFEEAEKCFQRALLVSPNQAKLFYSFGLLEKAKGNYEEAFKYWDKMVELEPSSTTFRTAYAMELQKAGRIADAIKHITIVYEADPKDEDIVQQVVLIYISARSIPYHVKAMDIIMKRLQLPFDVPGMDQQYKQILGKISVEVAGLQKEARHIAYLKKITLACKLNRLARVCTPLFQNDPKLSVVCLLTFETIGMNFLNHPSITSVINYGTDRSTLEKKLKRKQFAQNVALLKE